MICASTTTRSATTTRNNLPIWRDGWTTASGLTKAGFWQVRVEGRYVSLASYGSPSEGGKKGSKEYRRNLPQAIEAMNRMMAEKASANKEAEIMARLEETRVPLVVDVCNLALNFKVNSMSPSWKKAYEKILAEFCKGSEGNKRFQIAAFKGWGHLRWDEVHEGIIEEWTSKHGKWGVNGVRAAVSILKATFEFACSHTSEGFAATGKFKPVISENPLRNYRLKMASGRETEFTKEEEDTFRKTASEVCPAFVEFFNASIELGARPGELRRLQLRHFDAKAGQFILQPSEWKNGKKTRKCRHIHLNQKWIDWATAKAATMNDNDYFFQTTRGCGWGKSRVVDVFAAIRDKAGLNKKISLYSARHSFITRAIRRGAPVKHIAVQCGTSVRVIESTYDHSIKYAEVGRGVVEAVAGM